jgi:hypothetical protein
MLSRSCLHDIVSSALLAGRFDGSGGPASNAAIDAAIDWLAHDYFCDASGYVKQRVMRGLAQVKLSARQAAEVRGVLVAVVSRGPRKEFRDACRLARAVDHIDLRRALTELQQHDDPGTRQRATWMLQRLK